MPQPILPNKPEKERFYPIIKVVPYQPNRIRDRFNNFFENQSSEKPIKYLISSKLVDGIRVSVTTVDM